MMICLVLKGDVDSVAQKYPMTPTGKKKLEKKLTYLKEEKLKEINDDIKCLRGFCDFLDDASYKEMVDQQYFTENQIKYIEEMLYNSEVIRPKDEKSEAVSLGSVVTFVEIPNGDEETYTIVGEIEANPMEQKISMESPIGKGLLGSKINEEVLIEIPSGRMNVRIIDIT